MLNDGIRKVVLVDDANGIVYLAVKRRNVLQGLEDVRRTVGFGSRELLLHALRFRPISIHRDVDEIFYRPGVFFVITGSEGKAPGRRAEPGTREEGVLHIGL